MLLAATFVIHAKRHSSGAEGRDGMTEHFEALLCSRRPAAVGQLQLIASATSQCVCFDNNVAKKQNNCGQKVDQMSNQSQAKQLI